MNRTWVDAARDIVRDVAGLDWLTAGAFLLTIGSFLGAVLDSYTSLCVIGATQGHIGSVTACPDVHGWDTRTFPLSVDMGWGGALLSVVRLARTIGIGSWRWWAVLAFEALTAAFTIAGNAFHGAVLDGATSGLAGSTLLVVISSVSSAVPGVVAVGSGFTLSVLVSTRSPQPADRPNDTAEEQPAELADERTGERNPTARVAARAEVRRLLNRHGNALTAKRIHDRTGVSISRARALLREERGLRLVGAAGRANEPPAAEAER